LCLAKDLLEGSSAEPRFFLLIPGNSTLWIAQHSELKPALFVILPNLTTIKVNRSPAGNLLPPPSLSQQQSLTRSAASRSAPVFESWRRNLLNRQAVSHKDAKNRL